MLPELAATYSTPCCSLNSSISGWTVGFVVTSVATQRRMIGWAVADVITSGWA
jgi:hypothetical protein